MKAFVYEQMRFWAWIAREWAYIATLPLQAEHARVAFEAAVLRLRHLASEYRLLRSVA